MKICLDAGHGINANKGACNDYFESNGNYALSLMLKDELEKYKDVEVLLTKTALNQDPDLDIRGVMAKGCDLFLSLHSDATNVESTSRVMAIRSLKRTASQSFGEKLVKAVCDVMGLKATTTSGAVNGVWTRAYSSTQTNLDWYGVIRSAAGTDCQNIYLLECGHHTNTATCKWLDSSSNRAKLAKAISESIAENFKLQLNANTETTECKECKNKDAYIEQLKANLEHQTNEVERFKAGLEFIDKYLDQYDI